MEIHGSPEQRAGIDYQVAQMAAWSESLADVVAGSVRGGSIPVCLGGAAYDPQVGGGGVVPREAGIWGLSGDGCVRYPALYRPTGASEEEGLVT